MARGDTQEGSAKAAVHLLVKCTNIVRACTLYYKCVDNLATAVVGFQMILYYTFTHHSAVTQRFFLLVLVLVLFWGPPRFLAAFFFPPCAAAPRPLIISFQFETRRSAPLPRGRQRNWRRTSEGRLGRVRSSSMGATFTIQMTQMHPRASLHCL